MQGLHERKSAHKSAVPASVDIIRDLVIASLDEDKAEDIVTIDLAGKSTIADYLVIASGRSTRHVSSLADHVLRRLKEDGHGNGRVEGMAQADWVLIDVGDVIVHLFRPEVRAFYNLEKMWAPDLTGSSAEDTAIN